MVSSGDRDEGVCRSLSESAQHVMPVLASRRSYNKHSPQLHPGDAARKVLLSCRWRRHHTVVAHSYSEPGCACENCRHLLSLHITQLQTELRGTCCGLNMQPGRSIAARHSQGACAGVVPTALWTLLNGLHVICRHILMSQTLVPNSHIVIITIIIMLSSS